MSFCKELIWTIPLSAGGILLGMTRDPQAIIGGLVMSVALSIKWRMLMFEQQENFLIALKSQSNGFTSIASKFDWIIKKQKEEEKKNK
jgi:hypothetical protein